MRLGMNVVIDHENDGTEFIPACFKAGLRSLRFVVTPGVSIMPEVKLLEAEKAKAALSLYRVDPTKADQATQTFGVESQFQEIVRMYEERCFELPVERSLGVLLPEGMHYIMRVGRSQTRTGLLREQIIARLNILAAVIRKAGHKVVLPARTEDIIGAVWHGFKCDILDIEMMVSKKLEADAALHATLAKLGIPYWFGKAGVVGGYVMPAEQVKFIRKLIGLKLGADLAFLWSEAGDARWAWSQDGKFVVDVLGTSLAVLQTKRAMTADPVVAGWKTRLREAKA